MIDQLPIESLMIFIKITVIFNSSDRIFKNAGMIDHFKMIDHFDRSVKVVYSKSLGMSHLCESQLLQRCQWFGCNSKTFERYESLLIALSLIHI